MGSEQNRHSHSARKYERVLRQTRTLEGFKDFLQPKIVAELAPAAVSWPVVIVNMHSKRSDALILLKDGSIQHVSLDSKAYICVNSARVQFVSSLKEADLCSRKPGKSVRKGDVKPALGDL
jgi:hypothetical protein